MTRLGRCIDQETLEAAKNALDFLSSLRQKEWAKAGKLGKTIKQIKELENIIQSMKTSRRDKLCLWEE